jgi:hypothetical protein
MSADAKDSHVQLAAELSHRVRETGVLDRALRREILTQVAGGPGLSGPIGVLANQIGEDSFRVTDAQVQAVLAELGSEKSTFEVILTSAIGAGLRCWDAALESIAGVDDATS